MLPLFDVISHSFSGRHVYLEQYLSPMLHLKINREQQLIQLTVISSRIYLVMTYYFWQSTLKFILCSVNSCEIFVYLPKHVHMYVCMYFLFYYFCYKYLGSTEELVSDQAEGVIRRFSQCLSNQSSFVNSVYQDQNLIKHLTIYASLHTYSTQEQMSVKQKLRQVEFHVTAVLFIQLLLTTSTTQSSVS